MATAQTRDRIVQTAQMLFHEKGYAGTGLAEILRESGAGSGSLYHFFRSKEELLLAILARLEARLETEVVAPSLAATDEPVGQVFAILGFYREFLSATGCRLGCPVGNLAGEIADTHPAVRARLAALFTRWRAAVGACLRRCGHLAADPDELAVFVLTVMEGGVMQARVERSLAPFDTSVRLLRDYFERLMKPPGDHR